MSTRETESFQPPLWFTPRYRPESFDVAGFALLQLIADGRAIVVTEERYRFIVMA